MKKLLRFTIITMTIFIIIGCNNSTDNGFPKNKPVKEEDTVVKEIKDIDTDLDHYLPLGIDSVKLMSSGKVILVTNDEKTSHEELTVSLNVKDVYIYPFGNGGYRSILFLKNDGTVSIVNASELIQNKKIQVIDNVGNYNNVVAIESVKDSDASLIKVVLESGEKHILDEYIK